MKDLQLIDALSLQLWLPILREAYRMIGYADVPPQNKVWEIYHCVCAERLVAAGLDPLSGRVTVKL